MTKRSLTRLVTLFAILIAIIAVVYIGHRGTPAPAQQSAGDVPSSTSAPASSAADASLVTAGLATTSAAGTITVNAADVDKLVAGIPTSNSGSLTGYTRAAFGPAWADVNHNGCDTRDDILTRDLVDVTYKPGTHNCVVLTGTLDDPYTGKTIHFVRGVQTSTAVQIDHVLPIALAYEHGASSWTATQRETFANDPDELAAVDGSSNEAKGDGGPGEWMPPNTADACAYVARFTYITAKYSLTITSTDQAAIERVLQSCS